MDLSALNPHIRHARLYNDFIIKSTNSRCYDCRLFYIKEGSGTLTVEGEKYDFSSDSVIFLPPGSIYSFNMNPGKVQHLIFNFDLVCDFSDIKESLGTAKAEEFDPKKMPSYPLLKEFSAPIFLQASALYETLKKCTDDFLQKPPYYREVCSARLKRCLLELLRFDQAEPESAVIKKITDYIHAHYQEPTLTNEKIAAAFHYHPYYISQLMKKSTGNTLHYYLLHYRIRMAKNELITTDADINTIGWRCGFNSTAYFIKQFKAHTGTTPLQYRKKHIDSIY
jgi:AraC-like DNA-binding protein